MKKQSIYLTRKFGGGEFYRNESDPAAPSICVGAVRWFVGNYPTHIVVTVAPYRFAHSRKLTIDDRFLEATSHTGESFATHTRVEKWLRRCGFEENSIVYASIRPV